MVQIARSFPHSASLHAGYSSMRATAIATLLLVNRLALDGAAAQQAALLLREVRARMNGAPIVPHQEIAELPDMLVDVFAALADVIELAQNRIALVLTHALDARGHQPVDEQRLATSVGMRDEQRVVMVRDAA